MPGRLRQRETTRMTHEHARHTSTHAGRTAVTADSAVTAVAAVAVVTAVGGGAPLSSQQLGDLARNLLVDGAPLLGQPSPTSRRVGAGIRPRARFRVSREYEGYGHARLQLEDSGARALSSAGVLHRDPHPASSQTSRFLRLRGPPSASSPPSSSSDSSRSSSSSDA